MALKIVDGAEEIEITAAEATSLARELVTHNTSHSTSLTTAQYIYGYFQELIGGADINDKDRRWALLSAAAKDTALTAGEA